MSISTAVPVAPHPSLFDSSAVVSMHIRWDSTRNADRFPPRDAVGQRLVPKRAEMSIWTGVESGDDGIVLPI